MLKVTNKGSILTPNGILLRPGVQVTRGVLTDHMIRTHIKSGYLTEILDHTPLPPVEPESGPAVKQDNVGESIGTSITSPTDLQDAQTHEHGRTMVAGANLTNDRGEVVTQGIVGKTDEVQGDKLVPPGKWNSDPTSLLNKDLDSLNLMILDIDGAIEPLETVEEAIAFLSMDWKGQEK